MADQPQRPTWETSINPQFLQRVTMPLRLTAPRRNFAELITGRIDRMLGRGSTLGAEIGQRWQTVEGVQRSALPLAYGQRLPETTPSQSMPSVRPMQDSNDNQSRPIVTSQAQSVTPQSISSPVINRHTSQPVARSVIRPKAIQRVNAVSASTSDPQANQSEMPATSGQPRNRESSPSADSSSASPPSSDVSGRVQRTTQIIPRVIRTHDTRFIYRQIASDRENTISNQVQEKVSSSSPPLTQNQTVSASASEPNRASQVASQIWLQRRTNPLQMTLTAKNNTLSQSERAGTQPIMQRQSVIRRPNNVPKVTIQRQGDTRWIARKFAPHQHIKMASQTVSDGVIARTFGESAIQPAPTPAEVRLPSGTVIPRVAEGEAPLTAPPNTSVIQPASQRSAEIQRQVNNQAQISNPESTSASINQPLPINQGNAPIQRESLSGNLPQEQIQRLNADNTPSVPHPEISTSNNQPIQHESASQDLAQGEIHSQNRSKTPSGSNQQMPLNSNQPIQRESASQDLVQGQIQPQNAGDVLSGSIPTENASSANNPEISLDSSNPQIQRDGDASELLQGQVQRYSDQNASQPNQQMPLSPNAQIQRNSDTSDTIQEQNQRSNAETKPISSNQQTVSTQNNPVQSDAISNDMTQGQAGENLPVGNQRGTVSDSVGDNFIQPERNLTDLAQGQFQRTNSEDTSLASNQAMPLNRATPSSQNIIQTDSSQGQIQRSDTENASSDNNQQRPVTDSTINPQSTVSATNNSQTASTSPNAPIQRQSDSSDLPQGQVQRQNAQNTLSSSNQQMPLNVTSNNAPIQRASGSNNGQSQIQSANTENTSSINSGNLQVERSRASGELPQGQIQRNTAENVPASTNQQMPLSSNMPIQRQSTSDELEQGQVQRQNTENVPASTNQQMPLSTSMPIQRENASNELPQGQIQRTPSDSQTSAMSPMPLNQSQAVTASNQTPAGDNSTPLQRVFATKQAQFSGGQQFTRPVARGTIQRETSQNDYLTTQPIYRNIAGQGYDSPSQMPISVSGNQQAVGQISPSISSNRDTNIQRNADPTMSHPETVANTVQRLRQDVSNETQQIIQREVTTIREETSSNNKIVTENYPIQRADDNVASNESEPDVNAIAEKVWRRIVRRLGIERERRGGRKWF